MSPRHAVTRPRRAGDALRRSVRALVALVALAALVVGVPLVLLQFGHWPITGVPTWEQVQELPSTLATDGAVLAVVTVALWAAWAAFVASVVVEAAAQVRGRRRGFSLPSGSLGGPLRGAARYLIGSLLMSVGPMAATAGVTGLAPAGAQTAPEPAIVAPLWSPTDTAAGDVDVALGDDVLSYAGPEAAAVPVAPPTVVVERGDSPWSLASAHLGDGARWREIWEVNRSRAQPDGSVWLDPEQSIQPGWQLLLPPDAQVAPEADPAAETGPTAEATPAAETVPAADAAAPIQALTGQPAMPTEVTVQPGDNFWDLAEDQLASAWGRQPTDAEVVGHWQALIDQNRDALAPPGDPDLIYPGQVFSAPTAPADPTDVQGLMPSGPAGPATTPEQPASCETPPTPQAPATPTPPPAPAEPDASSPESPATTETTVGSATAPEPDRGTGGDPDGSRPDPAPPETTRPDIGSDESKSSPGEHVPTAAVNDADEQRDSLPVGLIGGGVAVAGALILLERRRRAQQRHRRRGRVMVPPPPDLRTGEQQLRWGADIAGARLLDVALRAAAAGAGATGLPALRWAEAEPDRATLVLTEPSPAPAGFAAVAADRWVTTLSPHELAPTATHAASPAPTLVPVGTTELGTELLVDLESSGVVTVHGAADDVLGLLRAMVVAAATSVWSDQPRIVAVGLDPELGRLPGVEAATTLRDALHMAEAHADRTEAALRSLRCPTLAQARAVGATPEDWDPLIVVSAHPAPDVDDRRRVEALAGRPNAAVGLVTVPSLDARLLGRAFVIGDHGWLEIDGVEEPVRPRHLGSDHVGLLVELLDGARSHADELRDPAVLDFAPRRPATPSPSHRPPPPPPPLPPPPPEDVAGREVTPPAPVAPAAPPRTRLAEVMDGVEVVVRVLGEVEAVRRSIDGQPEVKLVPTRQRALEAISYLALRESAVDRENLEISLFPDGANSAKTVYNTVSSARALLGDGLFPPPAGGRYELSPAVVTDYGIFCELVADADETEDAEAAASLLAEALSLVRGEPFTGVGRSYAWVGPHRGMIVAQVVDAAEELAEVRLAMGDWRSAEWAARQGLRAFPSDERMYRLLMRTARAAGNIPGVQRVFRELCDVLADPDVGVEPEDTVHPETVELLEELTGSGQRHGRLGA
jgi:DNA-binding SARP family transcriptional activator/nucleoid-associated protein YgaU